MKIITGFKIDESALPAKAQTRSFLISGDEGAVFSMQIRTIGNKYYDFKTNTFTAANVYTSSNKLSNKKINKRYGGTINFPADTDGETYTIYLWAEPHFETALGANISSNKVLYTTDIKQIADSVVTIAAISSGFTAKYSTITTLAPNVTSTGSPLQRSEIIADIDWTFTDAGTDANGFGLFLKAQPVDQNFYTTTTVDIADTRSDDGGGSSHYNYIVDSIDNLGEGMIVTAVDGGSLSGTPTIVEAGLNSNGKPYIKMSSTQVFANGRELTIKAIGHAAMEKAMGISVEFKDFVSALVPLTKTVHGNLAGDTLNVTVNGTYGVGVHALNATNLKGIGINNSGVDVLIKSVSASSSAGTLVLQDDFAAPTCTDGTKLYIIGCAKSATIKGKVIISGYPINNQTIYLQLDDVFRGGAAGPLS
jgi:hypothetical protein